MSKSGLPDSEELELELIDAAVRYVAVADWFENRPVRRGEPGDEQRAMKVFNVAEAELRKAGGRLLRRLRIRELVLERALAELIGE